MTTIRGRFFSLTEPGKSFIIRDTARKHFRHYVEINLFEDSHGAQVFRDVDTVDKFHLALSLVAGKELGSGKEDTIVFLDEIQEHGKLLPLLKFINQDGRYRYIASGSALGVELSRTSSIPMGSITIAKLFPLDFEEFLWAAGVAKDLIAYLRSLFKEGKEVDFLINDYDNLCILPIEVKSGRDWQIHSSLTRMVTEGARKGIVLCNSNKARHREDITYLPVYMAAFL